MDDVPAGGPGSRWLRLWHASAYRPIVTHPALRRLLPAFALSAVGDGMSAVAVALLALRLAGPGQAGIAVGAAVAAYTLPGAAGAALLARPLRRVAGARLVAADATLRAAALGVIPVLFEIGGLSLGVYVGVLAVSSLLHAWGIAGRYTLLAEQLPQRQRLAGNALLSTLDQGAVIVGPVLAGLVITASDPSVAITADAATFALLAVAARTTDRRVATARTDGKGPQAAERTHGFRFIAANPILLGLLLLSFAFFFLYGPVEVALPLYVVGPLHGSAGLLGVFWAVFGVGALIGSITTGLLRRLPLWPTAIAAVIGWGFALLPLGLLDARAAVLASFAIGGLLYAPFPALSATLFQRESPPDRLSEVLAARGALTVLAAPVGTALGGPLVVATGAQTTLLISALATITLGLVALTLYPRLTH